MVKSLLKRAFKTFKFLKDPIAYARELGVIVGSETKIATSDFGSEPFLISIGNNCHITKKVKFITHDGGVWVFRKEYPDMDVFGKILINDNVYVGNDCVIMPGVTIGSNVVIGAGSLITKSIPDNSVVAGVPAKIVCSIDDYKERMISKNFHTKGLKGQVRKDSILKQIEHKGLKKKVMPR